MDNRKGRSCPVFQVEKTTGMGLSDSGPFEAGCRGSESRLSLIVSKPARQDGFFIYIYCSTTTCLSRPDDLEIRILYVLSDHALRVEV